MIDEQLEFRKLNVIHFFENQIIREKRDRQKKNTEYTKKFNDVLKYLLEQNYVEAKKTCKTLKKCLKWLLLLELQYYCSVLEYIFPSDENLAFVFNFSVKHIEKFKQNVQKKLPVNSFIEKTYKNFIDFKEQEEKYKTLSKKNIAVCATMSAGKSTFVNALLGRDILPARSEATTSKITSVYDNDNSNSLIGFVEVNGKIVDRCLDTNLSIINGWNDDSNVSRIYLQGNLDGIGNNGIIAALHDTPGTNYSGDNTHHDITLKFLTSNKFDALIYVANTTQLCTTDEKFMLKEIYEKILQKTSMPMIFILNKVDCLDSEKENISDIIERYRSYLDEIGFKNAVIFPISSKAARILKMIKNNMSEKLTGKEKKELKNIQILFPDLISTGLPEVEKYIEKIIGGKND